MLFLKGKSGKGDDKEYYYQANYLLILPRF